MTASMKMKEMEIVKLKEDSKKMSKHFIQRKVEDQLPPSLVKVHIFVVKCFEFTVYVAALFSFIICAYNMYTCILEFKQ